MQARAQPWRPTLPAYYLCTRYGWPAEAKIVDALTKYKEDKALD